MISSARTGSGASSVRWTWLALALIAGVLGMHALSPAGMPAAGRHDMIVSAESPGHHPAPVHVAGADCRHLSDADDGGMAMDHAGGTCAAGGTSTAYVPPALTPGPAVRVESVAAVGGGPAAGPVDGRAPPDLSELQLLRI
ncbi:DUF6153 family protein [Streptomyces triticiradicis]|uniref:DUF1328 domain-containing protein n=1 Tax=Streptomyces triticiradicis TaxID=2651189 RepID=A0A7J5DJK3_9ACTN|nr:DUF6153 family protein [Streptomyces triticiradicis]KAB1988875.1 hypothetical protein F8144_09990 [Streptomyces triticiradicis]